MMEKPTPVEKLDLQHYELWLYTANDGEAMIGPAIRDQEGNRIGQLVVIKKRKF